MCIYIYIIYKYESIIIFLKTNPWHQVKPFENLSGTKSNESQHDHHTHTRRCSEEVCHVQKASHHTVGMKTHDTC